MSRSCQRLPRNSAAQSLRLAASVWRYADAPDTTSLPEHLSVAEVRHLAAFQLGAALTPGDVRARLAATI